MLSDLDAATYKDQLHPAYAGYLHDGEISSRDFLATLFQLMKTGIIIPVFQDNNMNKKIDKLRRTKKEPYYDFEKQICNKLFNHSNEISAEEVKKNMGSDEIEKILKNNIRSISAFPLIDKKLRFLLGDHGEAHFSINGIPVTNIKVAREFKNTLTKILMPLFFATGLFFLGIQFYGGNKMNNLITTGALTIHINDSSEFIQKFIFLFMGIMFITIPLIMYLAFIYSDKVYSYKFKSKIIPFAKERYKELFDFIKARPLLKHNFNNEFLPFSIAFGLDNSWNKDFGIEEDKKIDKSSFGPLI